jgi:Spy/CpxP family protein refolding chaperone
MLTGRMRALVAIGVLTAVTVVPAGTARSQHGSGGHDPGGHGSSHAAGGHGAGTGHQSAQRCETEFEQVIGQGRGFGMGFAADQHGYPGPMHVLELRDQLQLSAEQARQVEALMQAMFAESRPKSARLLEAERRLRALFAAGRADEAAVRAAVVEVEQARREVRLVHLLTHLRTRDLLTDAQRRLYHEARWGR